MPIPGLGILQYPLDEVDRTATFGLLSVDRERFENKDFESINAARSFRKRKKGVLSNLNLDREKETMN